MIAQPQEYTLTDAQLTYTIPPFFVFPTAYCDVTYSLQVLDGNGNNYPCPTCFDPVTREFTFHYD